ncbi:MAG: universal stress protein [Betaproteobacteria bacterium]|nr:universal stress protein [Betaproteobacteria bacterium]
MFKNILVPTDGSKLSMKAVDKAIAFAKEIGATLTVLTVIPPYPVTPAGDGYVLEPITGDAWDKVMKDRADKILAAAEKRAKAKEFSVQLLFVRSGLTYDGIIAAAKKRKCDLIVMASHGRRGLSALLLGSETTKVLTHSSIPVLVCR